jgi:hypothetical protein
MCAGPCPTPRPRSGYLLAALFLAASSLFALRYGLSLRLDLKPPLARILQQKFGGSEPAEQGRDVRPKVPESPDLQDDGTEAGEQDYDSPKVDNDQDAADGQPGGKSGQDQNRQSAAKQGSSSSDESSGLLTKVEDAIENMISSLKPPQSFPDVRPQSGQDQSNQPAKVRQSGGLPGDSQEGRSGEGARDAQGSQGKSAGGSGTGQASKQPGSGIGSQDGDKNIRQAEQLAAMGKISEIIGKRSANLTGEVTVEVQSTSQQLRTPDARRGVQHSQSGAGIGRDEIPAALQTYA